MENPSRILNWIQRQGRCCLHCGSFAAGPSQFCKACEDLLWKRHSILRVTEINPGRMRVSFLFEWVPDEDRMVSKLMMAFKGGKIGDASSFYAQNFMSRLYGDKIPKNAVLVPCPSLNGRKHSLVLAQSFSELLGIPVRDVLKKNSSQKPQKSQSLFERYSTELTCLESLEANYVIFIDDIVTTGATALSAQRALRPNLGFEVWCLAHRWQLAAKRSF